MIPGEKKKEEREKRKEKSYMRKTLGRNRSTWHVTNAEATMPDIRKTSFAGDAAPAEKVVKNRANYSPAVYEIGHEE